MQGGDRALPGAAVQLPRKRLAPVQVVPSSLPLSSERRPR